MSFRAYLIEDINGRSRGRFVDFNERDLDAGDVLIGVTYSSINYKDALAATGAGKIVRRFPCIGGIDLAGTVLESSDPRYRQGDEVLITSGQIGVSHHGGYAQRARVPADWLLPLPAGLNLFEAMAIGTAGFTAALAIERMEHNGLQPNKGPVIVTGATGGVGSCAIEMLARRGYRVVTLTGKETSADFLHSLGASEILLRQTIDLTKIKPLDKATYAGAVDNLGGETLAWLLSLMQTDGVAASIGLAAGMNLPTTVAPFILRGVSLLGIDSVSCSIDRRQAVWRRLANDLKPLKVIANARTIAFGQLPDAFDDYLAARIQGRTVVSIAP